MAGGITKWKRLIRETQEVMAMGLSYQFELYLVLLWPGWWGLGSDMSSFIRDAGGLKTLKIKKLKREIKKHRKL